MLVPPRPTPEDDPLFAVRVAVMAVVCIVAIQMLKPPLAPILASLPVGLIAAQRMAFNPFRILGGVLAIAVLAMATAALAELLRELPLAMLLVTGLLYTVGFHISLTTGSPLGLVLLIVTALTMLMGMTSTTLAIMARDSFLMSALTAGLAIPVLYTVLPPRTTRQMPEDYVPAPQAGLSAVIRAMVLLALTLWLHGTLYVADNVLAVAAIFALVLPVHRHQWAEVIDRTTGTAIGAVAALAILALLVRLNQFPVLLLLVFLASLVLARRMMTSRLNATVYQFSLSVMLALIAIALTTQSPGYAAFTRFVVTLLGAAGAVLATAFLESFLLRGPGPGDQADGALAKRR